MLIEPCAWIKSVKENEMKFSLRLCLIGSIELKLKKMHIDGFGLSHISFLVVMVVRGQGSWSL